VATVLSTVNVNKGPLFKHEQALAISGAQESKTLELMLPASHCSSASMVSDRVFLLKMGQKVVVGAD
jgi:hypothetical protein